jgi:hypothetical protein
MSNGNDYHKSYKYTGSDSYLKKRQRDDYSKSNEDYNSIYMFNIRL